MRSHVRWNVPRVALVLARPKRFQTDSGSMPPMSSFPKGCPGPGTPHVNLDEAFASYRLLAGRERTQRMSPRVGSLTTPPLFPRCGAPACSPARKESVQCSVPRRDKHTRQNDLAQLHPRCSSLGGGFLHSPARGQQMVQ